MYEKKTAKNGRVMYFKDGHLISRHDIPEAEIWKMEGLDQDQVDQMLSSHAPIEYREKDVLNCVFGEEEATTSRFINGASIPLCDDHYMNKTTGEIVAQNKTVA